MAQKNRTLKARAVAILARREHTRQELSAKLAEQGAEADEITTVLDDLIRAGLLSDARFAEQLVQSRKRKAGAMKIAHELAAKGVDEETAERLLDSVRADEFDTVQSLWRKKFGVLPQTGQERARQVRFFQSRGYRLEVILKVLRATEE